MDSSLRSQIDWEQPFTPEEYADRRRRVREALQRAELDAIFITNPPDITWLTNYDSVWYHMQSMTGVLVRADRDEDVFFDTAGHETMVATTPEIRDCVFLEHNLTDLRPDYDAIVTAIAERGLAKARIGIQPWAYFPHGDVSAMLRSKLEAAGATVENHSYLIEEVRFVKSTAEVAVVRRAAAIADEAMAAARDAIAEGVMETELDAVIMGSMLRNGGGIPSVRTMLGTGPRSGTHHSPPQHRRIKQGDLVFIDFCASLHRYHVNVDRTFSLGEPDKRWSTLMDKSAGCIDAVIEGVKVGDNLSKVHDVANTYTDAMGLRDYVWFVGGYSLGISVPPDWSGIHWITPREFLSDRVLTPGLVFNLENEFDVREDWPGGSGACWIETFLVTEDGLEILSRLPRTLVAV